MLRAAGERSWIRVGGREKSNVARTTDGYIVGA